MHERTVLLNKLISESKCRSNNVLINLPVHGIEELSGHIIGRVKAGVAIEFAGDLRDFKADDERIEAGRSGKYDFIRIKEMRIIKSQEGKFLVVLIHHVDQRNRSFPVLNIETYEGREIAADPHERGVTSAHLVIMMPSGGDDTGEYRAVLEYAAGIPRKSVELLLNRQITRAVEWETSVIEQGKRGPKKEKIYKYTPYLHLASEVYRNMLAGDYLRSFSSAVFTKRSTLESTAKEVDVIHKDVVADIELKVSANQAPQEPEERKSWLSYLVDHFQNRGYTARLYYKHLSGRPLLAKGAVEAEGAADRLICNTETYTLNTELSKWDASIRDDAVAEIVKLLRREELWQRAK